MTIETIDGTLREKVSATATMEGTSRALVESSELGSALVGSYPISAGAPSKMSLSVEAELDGTSFNGNISEVGPGISYSGGEWSATPVSAQDTLITNRSESITRL